MLREGECKHPKKMKVQTTPPSLPIFGSTATLFSLSIIVFAVDFCIGSDTIFIVDF